MIDIFNFSVSKEFLSYLVKDIIDPNKEIFYINYLCSRNTKKGNFICNYIGKILAYYLSNNIEIELCIEINKSYINKIPVELSKKWNDM